MLHCVYTTSVDMDVTIVLNLLCVPLQCRRGLQPRQVKRNAEMKWLLSALLFASL